MDVNFPDELGQDTLVELFELSFDPMCVIRRNGRLLLVNEAFKKFLTISGADLYQKSIFDFIHTGDFNLITDTINNAYKYQTVQTIAFRLVCATAMYKWFLWKFHPRDDEFIYAVAKDITPFQQLETVEHARSQFAEALLDTVLTINNNDLTLDIVLQRILSNIIKVVSFNHVHIMLIKEKRAVIAAVQNAGEGSLLDIDILNSSFALEDFPLLSTMIESKQPVIVNDVATDKNWKTIPEIEISGSYLACPVIVDGQVIAFINVLKLQTNFYTSIHARQLLMFANHVAIAIKNAYLFEQAEVAATLNERQRLARELHDSVNQILFSAGTYARLIPQVIHTSPEKVTDYASKISQRIKGALAQMRTILVELQPESLANNELSLLLKQLCNAFTGNTEISVHLDLANKVIMRQDAKIAYYRIAQEALHNIEKHANATEVSVSFQENDHIITLTIKDNGLGFDAESSFASNFGLKNMHDRAKAIGANLSIESSIGSGTCIRLEGSFNDRE